MWHHDAFICDATRCDVLLNGHVIQKLSKSLPFTISNYAYLDLCTSDICAIQICAHLDVRILIVCIFAHFNYVISGFAHFKYVQLSIMNVGSINLQVSFAEYRLFCRALVQKRPIILSILLTKATPYVYYLCRVTHMNVS